MPVYEFYCYDCHKIFKFLSRRVNVEKRPACPACGRPEIERQVSIFAAPRKRREEGDDDMPDLDIDESKLESAMQMLEKEAEGLDEEDPRQAAHLMRKLYDATGLDLTPAMKEAIERMEGGEDPETIEEDLGDVLEQEDPLGGAGLKSVRSLSRRLAPPEVDDQLYDL